jgi:mannose-1-phosphate guanylyltransferase/phosphomannomutase
MVPLLGKPMLEYAIEHLLRFGVTDMAFTLGYKPSVITEYFTDHAPKEAHIEYYIEDTPLGTAGSVKNASAFIDGAFLVFSGDALTDIDISAAAEYHRRNAAAATIVLKRMGNPLEYGVVISGSEGGVERFVEKPGWEDVFSDTINTGIYILDPSVLEMIPSGQRFDFAKDLFPLMMQKNMPIYGYVAQGYWCDVGNIEAYIKAHEDMLKGSVSVRIPGKNVGGIWVGEGANISNSALVQSPGFIGAGAAIGDGARIGSYSCIGPGARVGAYANLKRSILLSGARVGRHTKLSGCVIGTDASVGERCSVYEGAVVGERCSLAGDNRVSPHVRLWPEKWLHAGAAAGENIIWGHGERTNFIGKSGFMGDMGEDMTPLRLGRIFGAAAEVMSGKSVALCSDGTDFADAAMKQAAGMFTMSGCDALTFRAVQRPVFAYAASLVGAQLCVSVKSAKGLKLFVDLFEPELFMLSKQMRRQMEARYFHQGEVLADMRCGRETKVDTAESLYIHTGCGRIDCAAVRSADMRVVVRGGRSIDAFAARALEACGISVQRQIEDVQTDAAALVAQESAHFAVRISRNATHATLFLADGRVIDSEDFRAVCWYLVLAGLERKAVTLATGASGSVVSVARRLGLEVTFGSEQDAMLALKPEQRRVLFDSICATARLAEHIARTGAAVEEIASMIRPGHVRVREIGCDWEDVGRVIGGMYRQGAYASEGLRFEEGKGFGYICPHTTHPRIIVRTEGDTEEFASELCEKYADMVKRIIRQPKGAEETKPE